jgi:hypothetical protein
VIAVLGLLRKYLPARKSDPQALLDSNGDVEDFTYANAAVYTGMVVVMIAFAFFSYKGLVAANSHFAEKDGTAAFRLLPQRAIWYFFPGFGALCLSWDITLFLWSLFGDPKRVSRFIGWSSERAGYDTTRALRWSALFVAMPLGIASILAIPLHSTLGDTAITVGHYARLTRQNLPYSQARRLVRVDGSRDRTGKFSPRAEMILDFDDGSRWSSAANRDFKTEVDPGLTEFLQEKTGLPVQHAEREADLRAQTR